MNSEVVRKLARILVIADLMNKGADGLDEMMNCKVSENEIKNFSNEIFDGIANIICENNPNLVGLIYRLDTNKISGAYSQNPEAVLGTAQHDIEAGTPIRVCDIVYPARKAVFNEPF